MHATLSSCGGGLKKPPVDPTPTWLEFGDRQRIPWIALALVRVRSVIFDLTGSRTIGRGPMQVSRGSN